MRYAPFIISKAAPKICCEDLGCCSFNIYMFFINCLITNCLGFANVNFKGISNRGSLLCLDFILLQRFNINRKSYEDKKSLFVYDGYSISPGQLQ